MQTFFHGWRRKAGLVLLVMAMVATGGWLRSYTFSDTIAAGRTGITSDSGALESFTCTDHGDEQNTRDFLRWRSLKHQQGDGFKMLPRKEVWCLQFCGFKLATDHVTDRNDELITTVDKRTVPYWITVCPLTLLSAYLLLWPRRKR